MFVDKVFDRYCKSMLRRRVNVPTARNIKFEFWTNHWYIPYSIATLLMAARIRMHKKLSIRWVHSCQMFQQHCAIPCQCSSSGRRGTKLHCCCRNREKLCQQLVWLSNYWSQSPFKNKAHEWRKDSCSNHWSHYHIAIIWMQQGNFYVFGFYQRSTLRSRTESNLRNQSL